MSNRTGPDPELEADLLALLQGRPDPDRIVVVADYLSKRAERMADVLADARNTAALRLALAAADEPTPPRLVAEARRLQDRLRGQRLLRRIAPLAAAIVVFAAGWSGMSPGKLPDTQALRHWSRRHSTRRRRWSSGTGWCRNPRARS